MQETRANLWKFVPPDYSLIYRGVPTNGVVRNGKLVMGAGVAADAKKQFPELPSLWGMAVEKEGNIPHFGPWYVSDKPYDLVTDTGEGFFLFSFPTKNHYNQDADGYLIMKSAIILAEKALSNPYDAFIIPRPGVGLGRLDWRDVRPMLLALLPDNVFVVHQ